MRLNSRGKALPITEITPTAPNVMRGKVIPSSPEITLKFSGLFLIISSICVILPDASLIATTLLKSRAIRNVVSAVIFTPVRPGTLYNTMGSSVASAIAL